MAANIVQIQMPIHMGARTKHYHELITAIREWAAENFPGTEHHIEFQIGRVKMTTTAFDPASSYSGSVPPKYYFRVFVTLMDAEQAAWFAMTFTHPACMGIETNVERPEKVADENNQVNQI